MQKIPIVNSEPPIVRTGAENIVPALASKKFLTVAEDDGIVDKVVPGEYLIVKYKSGKINLIDISNNYSKTKRNSIILISFDHLKQGDKFKKNDMITWSKMFKNGVLSYGRNSKVAVMNYKGLSHEDQYVLSEDCSNSFMTEFVEAVKVVVPRNATVLKFETEIGKQTTTSDILLEFQLTGNVENYISSISDELLSDTDNEDLNKIAEDKLNKSIIKFSPGGELIDIKIYLNTIKEIDNTIMNYWKNEVKKLTNKKEFSATINGEKTDFLDNIDNSFKKIGDHKFDENSAMVLFYIKKTHSVKKGNKMANRYGAKGIVGYVIPKDEIPYTDNGLKIDAFIAPSAILGRKNTSIYKELYIGKIFYYLPLILKERIRKGESDEKLKNLILKVVNEIDTTPDKDIFKNFESQLKNMKDFKENVMNDRIDFFIIIPPFVNIKFENIKKVANILNIELEEYLNIPDGTGKVKKTKMKVPVGIQYLSTMEQTGDDYEATRAQGKYVQKTGQPTTGKKREGGQSIGNLDVYNLLTYDLDAVFDEILSIRSDDEKRKKQVLNSLRNTGEATIPEKTSEGRTKQLLKLYLMSLGIKINTKSTDK